MRVSGAARVLLVSMLVALSLAATARAAEVTGTNGDNSLFFQGVVGPYAATLVNPYSGASVAIDAEKNVNTASYDGLGGFDTLLMTNDGDVLRLEDDLGAQTFWNIEQVIAGNGDDIVDLASATYVLGDLTLDGGDGDDLLWGNAGNDILYGYAGADTLEGGPGDDTLTGGLDPDDQDGGTGDDLYVYDPGDGADRITDPDGADTLRINGVTFADLTLTRDGYDLVVDTDGTGLNTITIAGHYAVTVSVIETLDFPADGSTYTLEVCDGVDNNGDGQVDEGFDDGDGDGIANCVDPALVLVTGHVSTTVGDTLCGYLSFSRNDGPGSGNASTDVNGDYALYLPPGDYSAYAYGAGSCHGTQVYPGYGGATVFFDVTLTADTVVDAQLPPAHTVSGHVYDHLGAPVPGMEVHFYGPTDNFDAADLSTVTDAAGAYSILLVEGPQRASLNWPDGPVPPPATVQVLADMVYDFNLPEPPPPAPTPVPFSGRVLTTGGAPLCAFVEFTDPATGDGGESFPESDGSYAISLLEGTYTVEVTVFQGFCVPDPFPGYPGLRVVFPGVALTDGGSRDFVLPDAHTLSGRVLDPGGTPASGVTVRVAPRAEGPPGANIVTTSAADGAYAAVVLEGTHDVYLAPDGITEELAVAGLSVSADTALDLTLAGPPPVPVSVSGHVATSDGRPVCATLDFFPDGGGPSAFAVTDSDGAYQVDLFEGTYLVRVETLADYCVPDPFPGYPGADFPANLAVSGPTTRDFTVPAAYTVSGRVFDADGIGVPDVGVDLGTGPVTTAADGTYAVTLFGGTYWVDLTYSFLPGSSTTFRAAENVAVVSDRTLDFPLSVLTGVLVFVTHSPVDILVTAPNGLQVGPAINQVPGATYEEYDLDGDGEPNDVVTIPSPLAGPYQVQVIPDATAGPTDVYSLEAQYRGRTVMLASAVRIQDVPAGPYAYDTSAVDLTFPTISGLAVSDVTHAAARVSWTTDEPTVSFVEYGPTTAYGFVSAPTPGLAPAQQVDLAGLTPDTPYHLRARSTDAVGNESVSADLAFTTGPPPPVSISAEAAPAPDANGWNRTDVVVTFTCVGAAFCPAPVTVAVDGAGQVVSGTASDGAGHEATASVTLNIDQSPPALACPADLALDATDPGGIPAAAPAVAAFLAEGMASDALSGLAAFGNDAPADFAIGDTVITFSAADVAGNAAACAATLGVLNPPPVAAAIPPREVDEGQMLSVAVSAYDPNGEGIAFSGFGLPPGATVDPATGAVAYNPGFDVAAWAADAVFDGFVNVTDGTGTTAVPLRITVRNVNRPPLASAGVDQAFDCLWGTCPVTLDGTGSTDPDSAPGTQDDIAGYAWSDAGVPLGSGAALNTGLALGVHAITLTVTDRSGAASSDTVAVTIDPASLSLLTVEKAEVEWDHGRLKLHGKVALPVGRTYLDVEPLGAATVRLSSLGAVVDGSVAFTVRGHEGKKWAYAGGHGDPGIRKFKIDWKGARFDYNQAIRIKSEHLGAESTTLEIDRKDVTGAFAIALGGVVIQVAADGTATATPAEGVTFDQDDDDGEIEVELPFALTPDLPLAITGAVTDTLTVGDYYTAAVGRFQLEAGFDPAGADPAALDPTLTVELRLGTEGFPGTAAVADAEWREHHARQWKHKHDDHGH